MTDCPHIKGYDPRSPEELRDPYPTFKRARAECPVFYSDDLDLWSVARHADVIGALLDQANFSAGAAHPPMEPPADVRERMPEYPWARSVLMMDEPEHRPLRMILQAPFTPRGVKSRAPAIREHAEELLQPLVRGEPFEFMQDYAMPISLSLIAGILGLPHEQWGMLERSVESVFRLVGGLTGEDEILAASRDVADLNDFLYELVEDRRANPRDDYVSVMVQTRLSDGTEVATPQMVALVFSLIAAGFDTTANTQTLGMGALLSTPDQWARLKENRSLVDDAVDEMLRYRTLVKRLFRQTKHDVTLSGVTIPADSTVALLGASANHDEDACEGDPEKFELRKSRNLAFGRGIHFCVGAPLARLQMSVTLETMIDLVPDVRIAKDAELLWGGDLRFDGLAALHLENPTSRALRQPPQAAKTTKTTKTM